MKWRAIVSALGVLLATEAVAAAAADFGVNSSGDHQPPFKIDLMKDLGASWVRVNAQTPKIPPDLTKLLDAGLNVVVTMANQDPADIDDTYGSLSQFPHAGFPFRSKATYERQVAELARAVLPYVQRGRRVLLQCENEIGDASVNPHAMYWRGTLKQYLTQIAAFRGAVKGVSPDLPVVLSSFTSGGLAQASGVEHSSNGHASKLITTMIGSPDYDVVDLHFYGCVDDIPTEAAWVRRQLAPGKQWISTENGGPTPLCHGSPSWQRDLAAFERAEAEEVPRRLGACASAGGAVCLWFSLLDLEGEVDDFNHLGLVDQSKALAAARGASAGRSGLASRGRSGAGRARGMSQDTLASLLRQKPAYAAFKRFVAGRRAS